MQELYVENFQLVLNLLMISKCHTLKTHEALLACIDINDSIQKNLCVKCKQKPTTYYSKDKIQIMFPVALMQHH